MGSLLKPSSCDQKIAIEYIAVDQLKPNERSPRKSSTKQVKRLAASLRKFGWAGAIVIGQDNEVIAGNHLHKAAILNGMREVPVIRRDDLTEAEARALIIAMNRLGELGGWDNEILVEEFDFLIASGFETDVTGFGQIDIDALYGSTGAGAEETVVLPSADEPVVSRRGDLWNVGNHFILCRDAREAGSYELLLRGELAQMVFTDPPYNITINGNAAGIRTNAQREFAMASGEMPPAQFRAFLETVLTRIAAVSHPGAIGYVCIDWRHVADLIGASDAIGAELKNICVWAKTNFGMGSFYKSQHEFVAVLKLGDGEHINNFGMGKKGRNRTNLWTYAGANGFRKGRSEDLADHPTVKPTEMVADAILDCSRRKGIILDAFAGSGTTLVAAERTGRRGYGIELDPAYVDVIVRRLEKETGEEATLENGDTFAQVAAQRLQKEAA